MSTQPNFYYEAVVQELQAIADDPNTHPDDSAWALRMVELLESGAEMEQLSASVLVENLMQQNLRGSWNEHDEMGVPPDELDDYYEDAS